MNKTTIITHSGSAHRDELIACALVLSSLDRKDKAILERREPTEAELNDPSVWCIDIGLRHEPELLNFDHHQLSKDSDPCCAMTLVMEHLGLMPEARKYDWVTDSEILDSKGPYCLAEKLGEEALGELQEAGMIIPGDNLEEIEASYGRFSDAMKKWISDRFTNNLNPMERFILNKFSKRKIINEDDIEFSMLRMLGSSVSNSISSGAKRMKLIKNHASHLSLDLFDVIFLTSKEFSGQNLWEEVNILRKETGSKLEMSVTNDDRGEGLKLARLGDSPRIDFCRIQNDPDVLFVPTGGFLAKTRTKLNHKKIEELIKKATIFDIK